MPGAKSGQPASSSRTVNDEFYARPAAPTRAETAPRLRPCTRAPHGASRSDVVVAQPQAFVAHAHRSAEHQPFAVAVGYGARPTGFRTERDQARVRRLAGPQPAVGGCSVERAARTPGASSTEASRRGLTVNIALDARAKPTLDRAACRAPHRLPLDYRERPPSGRWRTARPAKARVQDRAGRAPVRHAAAGDARS